MLHYVYDRPFLAPHAAPLLIGLALMTRRHVEATFVRVALLGAALFVSFGSPSRLTFEVGSFDLTTAAVALLAAWLVLGYTTFPRWFVAMAGAAAVAAGWKIAGPSWDEITDGFARAWRVLTGALPTTRRGWGLTAVGGAFALLAAGVAVSLRKRQELPATSEADAPAPCTDSAGG